jgi:hypothetical protein
VGGTVGSAVGGNGVCVDVDTAVASATSAVAVGSPCPHAESAAIRSSNTSKRKRIEFFFINKSTPLEVSCL